jgi:NAD(P)-dependent dehydrogenase (short-subunit alcohol dehydrogenase family)
MSAAHFVVTGAGTGIGRAIALRLARDGRHVTLMARNEARLTETARTIVEAGGADPSVIPCDITDRAAVNTAFALAAERLGPLTGLVANSGLGGANHPGEDDRFDELVAVNLTGTYRCLRAAQANLADGPGPRHMVVISSILARIGVPGYTAYCASKTGLLGLTRSLACELAPDGVQVNAVCPGWVDTDMAREGIQGMAEAMNVSYEQALATAMEAVPVGKMSQPKDIAGVVAWLVSDDAQGVTGQSIDINGGAFMT